MTRGSSQMLHNGSRRHQDRKTMNKEPRIGRMNGNPTGAMGKDRIEMRNEAGNAIINQIFRFQLCYPLCSFRQT